MMCEGYPMLPAAQVMDGSDNTCQPSVEGATDAASCENTDTPYFCEDISSCVAHCSHSCHSFTFTPAADAASSACVAPTAALCLSVGKLFFEGAPPQCVENCEHWGMYNPDPDSGDNTCVGLTEAECREQGQKFCAWSQSCVHWCGECEGFTVAPPGPPCSDGCAQGRCYNGDCHECSSGFVREWWVGGSRYICLPEQCGEGCADGSCSSGSCSLCSENYTLQQINEISRCTDGPRNAPCVPVPCPRALRRGADMTAQWATNRVFPMTYPQPCCRPRG